MDGYIWVFIIIAIVVYLIIQPKLKKERAKAEREAQKREAEHKKAQEDLKYDQIINCPSCRGNGECIIFGRYGNYEQSVYKRIYNPPDTWHLAGQRKDLGDYREEYLRMTCPACDGNGIAYAYFFKERDACLECKGTGKIMKIIKKKMDIGVSEDKEEIICKKCNGQGNYEVEKVFIKRIAGTATLAQYGLSETFVDSLSNNKTIYSKSKPRFT